MSGRRAEQVVIGVRPKMSVGATLSGLILLNWLAAAGCGDDAAPPTTKPHRDSGAQDSGPDADVEPGDRDAASGGKGGSNGPDADGGEPSGGGKGGKGGSGAKAGSGGGGGSGGAASTMPDPDRCQVSDEDNSWSTMVPFSDDGRFALTTGTTGFGVAFQGLGCDSLKAVPVQAVGAFQDPTSVLDDCTATREISLLRVSQGWRVVWVDNAAGSFELESMMLSDDMSSIVGDVRTQLTTNMLTEKRPVLQLVGGAPMVAFIATDPESGKARISSIALNATNTVKDVLTETSERKPLSLALTQIGDEDAVVGWVDEEGKPGVWVQRIALDGTPKGEPALVSDVVSAGTTMDVSVRGEGEGGAVLYSVMVGGITPEVRFRRLSATGEVLADEIKIVGGVLQGRDASFARLGGGYAIAYRALPAGPITEPELRLTFVSKEGTAMRDAQGTLISYKIANAGTGGGRTTLRISTDGQVLVGLVDGDGLGTQQLRLIRKRLDCTL
jgi:hypothetical protein